MARRWTSWCVATPVTLPVHKAAKIRLLCYGIGNIDRGDDGQAPQLADWLEQQVNQGRFPRYQIQLEQPFQLQPENIYDFARQDLVLFIDADVRLEKGISLRPLAPQKSASAFITHALSPEHLLSLPDQLTGQPPPPAYLLSLSAQSMALGESLSDQAKSNIHQARQLLQHLLEMTPDEWQKRCDQTLSAVL